MRTILEKGKIRSKQYTTIKQWKWLSLDVDAVRHISVRR